MPVFDFHGVSVAYDRAGSGDPILFLHNIGGDRRIWSHQMRAPHSHQQRVRTGSVRLRRIGYTDQWVYGRQLRAPHLGIRRRSRTTERHAGGQLFRQRAVAVLCPAGDAAGTRPGAVQSADRRHPASDTDRLDREGRPAHPPRRTGLGDQGAHPGGHLGGARTARPARPPHGRHRLRRLPRPLDRTPPPAGPAAIARDFDRLAALDEFRPTLAFPPITTIWGAKNRILRDRRIGAQPHALPTRSLLLPDCGHLLMLEDPDTITAAIRSATASAIAS